MLPTITRGGTGLQLLECTGVLEHHMMEIQVLSEQISLKLTKRGLILLEANKRYKNLLGSVLGASYPSIWQHRIINLIPKWNE